MNNIEELKAAATAMRLSSTMRITDEIITFRRLFTPDCILNLIAQLEAAQKEPKETQEESDIPTLRSEAASIIGLLTAEGHQTFSLDKVADFFDDVFRKFELAEAELSAANEKLSKPVEFPDCDIGAVSHMAHWYSEKQCEAWLAGVEFSKKQIIKAGFTVEGE
ncbi:TPA: hypothetical protein ACPZUU_000028 [Yersinia enterocolitica]